MTDDGVAILIALYAGRRPSQGDPEGKERSEAEIEELLKPLIEEEEDDRKEHHSISKTAD